MGLAGYIIGGALQGLGTGMALKQKSEDEDRRAELAERRAIAMENLKSQNMGNREAAQSERERQSSAEKDQRKLSADLITMGKSAEYSSSMAASKTQAEIEDREDRQKHDLAKLGAEVSGRIREHNATYRDEIDRTETDEVSGEVTGITKMGKTVPLGKIARKLPRASASDTPSWLDPEPGKGPAKPGAAATVLNATRDKDGNYIIQ